MKYDIRDTAPVWAPETLAQAQREGWHIVLWRYTGDEKYSFLTVARGLELAKVRVLNEQIQRRPGPRPSEFVIIRPTSKEVS